MNWRNVRLIFLREVRDQVRDRRTLFMILVLFMVLILSVLGSSLMFVSRTETLSSLNYKTMSQARYGAEIDDTPFSPGRHALTSAPLLTVKNIRCLP